MTVVLSREMDFVPEVLVRRDFGTELVESPCPTAVPRVVEPLDVEAGNDRAIQHGEPTCRLDPETVASRAVIADPAEIGSSAGVQPDLGGQRGLPVERDDAAILADISSRLARFLEYAVVADPGPEMAASLPVLGPEIPSPDRLEGDIELGGVQVGPCPRAQGHEATDLRPELRGMGGTCDAGDRLVHAQTREQDSPHELAGARREAPSGPDRRRPAWRLCAPARSSPAAGARKNYVAPKQNRRRPVERGGKMMVQYLVDPNTGVAMCTNRRTSSGTCFGLTEAEFRSREPPDCRAERQPL